MSGLVRMCGPWQRTTRLSRAASEQQMCMIDYNFVARSQEEKQLDLNVVNDTFPSMKCKLCAVLTEASQRSSLRDTSEHLFANLILGAVNDKQNQSTILSAPSSRSR